MNQLLATMTLDQNTLETVALVLAILVLAGMLIRGARGR